MIRHLQHVPIIGPLVRHYPYLLVILLFLEEVIITIIKKCFLVTDTMQENIQVQKNQDTNEFILDINIEDITSTTVAKNYIFGNSPNVVTNGITAIKFK